MVASAIMLRSEGEFRQSLHAYVRALVKQRDEVRLREIFDNLLGIASHPWFTGPHHEENAILVSLCFDHPSLHT